MSLERDDCPPCALPRPLLAALMRAVARTEAWALYRNELIQRMPDDVWEDSPDEWIVTFQSQPSAGLDEELIMFEVSCSESLDSVAVRSAVHLARTGEEVFRKNESIKQRVTSNV